MELQSKGSGASQLPDPVGKIAPASCDSSKNSVTLARYGSSADKQRSYDSQIITSGAEKAVIAVGKSATSAINTNRPGSYHERLNKTKDAAIGSDDTPSCGCIGTSTDEPVAEFEHPRQNFKTKIGSKEPSGVKRMEDHAQQTTLRSEIRRVRPGVQSQGSQSTLRSPADQTRSSVAGEAIQTAPLDVFAAYGTAPAIEEIYPPASNPPFNPDFNQTGQVPIWSSTVQVGEGCAVPSRPPPSQPAVPCASYNPEKAPIPLESFVNGGVPPVAAAVNRRAPLSGERVALSFVLPTNAGQPQLAAPLEPPKYEEIMQNAGPQFPAGFHPASAYGYPDYGYPYPPGAQCGQPAPVRLIRAFGRYGEISTQPGTFRAPGRISVTGSGAGEKSPEGAVKIVVTDRQNGTVQVFTEFGECLSILRVDGVNGACMWTDNRRLTVGTDRGLEVYDINGTRQECIPIGPVINVVPYQTGFIAVQSRSLSVFKGPSPVLTRTIAGKNKPGQYNRLEPFDELVDIAISNQQDLVVLESSPSHGATITVMTEDGYVRSTIIPAQTESCGPLVQPCAIAVDSSLNIVVADSGSGTVTACGTGTPARVLLFGFSGRLQRVLFGAGAPSGSLQTPADDASRGPWPASLDVGPEDRLYVVMRGDKVAEIRVFTYS